jgi:hypothetical protein
MNRALLSVALLLLSSVAICQATNGTSDCAALKNVRHKVSCLCGSVQICSGDICGSPANYELDDDVTVELRDKSGVILDRKKALVEMHEEQGTTLDGLKTTYNLKQRRFSFEGKPDGHYSIAFILYKSGIPQPALVFATKYSHKAKEVGNTTYMLEPTCQR